MSRGSGDVFGFYVEKEYVGKRVKGSKVKVTWKFACLPDLKTNEVELKHSLVRGKREIKLNNQLVLHKKKMFTGDFNHQFRAGGRLLEVFIRDHFEGYIYDLNVDGVPFHRLQRINLEQLEEMRRSKRDAERAADTSDVKRMSFNDFVGNKPDKTAPSARGDSSDDDDEGDEEALWKDFQAQRKKSGAPTGKAIAQAAAPVAASYSGWGGEDPFASSSQPSFSPSIATTASANTLTATVPTNGEFNWAASASTRSNLGNDSYYSTPAPQAPPSHYSAPSASASYGAGSDVNYLSSTMGSMHLTSSTPSATSPSMMASSAPSHSYDNLYSSSNGSNPFDSYAAPSSTYTPPPSSPTPPFDPQSITSLYNTSSTTSTMPLPASTPSQTYSQYPSSHLASSYTAPASQSSGHMYNSPAQQYSTSPTSVHGSSSAASSYGTAPSAPYSATYAQGPPGVQHPSYSQQYQQPQQPQQPHSTQYSYNNPSPY
mmetsp:Transcript_10114/g.19825  ORF Transcript_10114/g.19825 Transcript_10114/m.19825 type:complete len:485 (-) Transcript_10114:34-1488(-)